MSYTVINKGRFNSERVNGYVGLTRFIFAVEEKQKGLYLQFFNYAKKSVTFVIVEVLQFDLLGQSLDTIKIRLKAVNAKSESDFVVDKPVPLYDDCVEFEVKISSVEFDNYSYSLKDKKLVPSYIMESDLKELNTAYAAKQQLHGVRAKTAPVQKPKVLFLICLFVVGMISIASFLCYFQLKSYAKHANTFFYNGVEYRFVQQNKAEGSDIIVVGGEKGIKSIKIPSEIEGYRVVRIGESAFAYHKALTKVVIEGDLTIGAYAFRGCKSLVEVDLSNVSKINDNAFSDAESLTELNAFNLNYIGMHAFGGCKSLTKINIENSEKILILSSYIFNNCSSLKEIKINQFVDYFNSQGNFNNSYAIEKLWLKNFAFSFELDGVKYNASEEQLYDFFGSGIHGFGFLHNNLTEIHIENLGEICANFLLNSSVVSFTVENFDSVVIQENAFSGSRNLRYVSIPNVTQIFDYAFFETAITEFDATKLEYIGVGAFSGCQSLTSFDLSQNTSLSVISDSAFKECTALTEIHVPKSVESIGSEAFLNCIALKEMTLPFVGHSKLTNESFKYIFSDYQSTAVPISLNKLTITNENVISYQAFQDCSFIKEIIINEGVDTIAGFAFSNCRIESFVVPSTVTMIYDNAFLSCSKLLEVYNLSQLDITIGATTNGHLGYYALEIHDSLEDMPLKKFEYGQVNFAKTRDNTYFATSYYGNLESVILPSELSFEGEEVTSYNIHKNFMANNNIIGSIVMPDIVKNVGENAFSDCANLQSVVFSYNTESIGENVLSRCSNLNSLEVPFVGRNENEMNFLSYFFGANVHDYWAVPYTLKSVTITNSEKIGDDAFKDCQNISNVILPSNLKAIGEGAFCNAFSLKEIILPEGLEVIGAKAFMSCNLKTLTIPKSVQLIRINAFYFCYKITEIILLGTPMIEDYAFYCIEATEVINMGTLKIEIGEYSNGGIGLYAIKVLESLTEGRLQEAVIDGLVFKYDDDTWTLIDYIGTANELTLDSFEYKGRTINEFKINRKAFSHSSIEKLTIGFAVKEIGEFAFEFSSLKQVIFLNSSITTIAAAAFSGCSYLESVELPSNLKVIGSSAFSGCIRLFSITIPKGVEAIEGYAFGACYGLSEVYNLSGLDIQIGEIHINGSIGAYAVRVYSTLDVAPLDYVYNDDFRAIKVDGEWYVTLINCKDQAFEFVESFEYNNETITSYHVYERLFSNYGDTTIYIKKSVKSFVGQMNSYSLSSSLSFVYDGTMQEWNNLLNNSSAVHLSKYQVVFQPQQD